MEPERKLKTNRLKSGETEMLISGGAIFSLVQLKSKVFEFTRIASWLFLGDAGPVGILLVSALGILIIGFGLHLILRGFWFSLFLMDDLTAQVGERTKGLNEFCSCLFSWAVSSAVMFFGLAIPVLFLLLLLIIDRSNQLLHLGFLLLVSTFSLFLIDLIFFGVLSKVKYIKSIFKPVHWFWDKFSLGFIWRPSLKRIFANVSNRFIFHLVTILITVSSFFYSMLSETYFGWDRIYENRGELSPTLSGSALYLDKRPSDVWIPLPAIQSDVITDGYVKIKVPRDLRVEEIQNAIKSSQKYQSELIKIKLDDSIVTDLKWVHMNQANAQQMMQTVIDIRNLKNGYHDVRIELLDANTLIPFWKE